MSRAKNAARSVDLGSDDFGCILNCAVRYALGRRTYMPGIVVNFILPLLPYLSQKTVYVFDQDLTVQEEMGGYGDEEIDRPVWMKFHSAVKSEEVSRGMKSYIDSRKNFVSFPPSAGTK